MTRIIFFKKGLVVWIILLFIGVGVQPVLADTPIITSEDIDEDCTECQVSDGYSLLKVRLLLFKVRVVTNIISSSKLGEIPEIKDKCKYIFNNLNTNKQWDWPIICSYLLDIISYFDELLDYLYDILPNSSNPIFIIIIITIIDSIALPFDLLSIAFGCETFLD